MEQPQQNIHQAEPGESLTVSLDYQVETIFNRLISWGKFVGIMNIVQGAVYSLSLLVLFIPTVVMGIFYILMGIKLISASNNIQIALYTKDNKSFIRALDDLRGFILINGILFIIGAAFFAVVLFSLLFLGNMFWDFFHDVMNDFAGIAPIFTA